MGRKSSRGKNHKRHSSNGPATSRQDTRLKDKGPEGKHESHRTSLRDANESKRKDSRDAQSSGQDHASSRQMSKETNERRRRVSRDAQSSDQDRASSHHKSNETNERKRKDSRDAQSSDQDRASSRQKSKETNERKRKDSRDAQSGDQGLASHQETKKINERKRKDPQDSPSSDKGLASHQETKEINERKRKDPQDSRSNDQVKDGKHELHGTSADPKLKKAPQEKKAPLESKETNEIKRKDSHQHGQCTGSNHGGKDCKDQMGGSSGQESKERNEAQGKETNGNRRKDEDIPPQMELVSHQSHSLAGAEPTADASNKDEDKVFWKSVDEKLDYTPPSSLFPPMVRNGPPRLLPRIEEDPPTEILDAVFVGPQDCQYYLCRWHRGRNRDKFEYHHVPQGELEKYCPSLLEDFMKSIWGVNVRLKEGLPQFFKMNKAFNSFFLSVKHSHKRHQAANSRNGGKGIVERYHPDYPRPNIPNQKPPQAKKTNPQGNSSQQASMVSDGVFKVPKVPISSLQPKRPMSSSIPPKADQDLRDSCTPTASRGASRGASHHLPKPSRGIEDIEMQMAGCDQGNGQVQMESNSSGRMPIAGRSIDDGDGHKTDSGRVGDSHVQKAGQGVGDGHMQKAGQGVEDGHMQKAGQGVDGPKQKAGDGKAGMAGSDIGGGRVQTSKQTSSKPVAKDPASRAAIPSLITSTFPKPPSPELEMLAREQQAREHAQLLHWLPSSLQQQGSILGSRPSAAAAGMRQQVPGKNSRKPYPTQFPGDWGQQQAAAMGFSQHAFGTPRFPYGRGAQMKDPLYEQALAAVGIRAPSDAEGLSRIPVNAQTLNVMQRMANDLPMLGGPSGTAGPSTSSSSSMAAGRTGFGGNFIPSKRGRNTGGGDGAASKR